MRIQYSRSALKVINSQDRPTKERFKAAIEKIPQGDIVPLKGCPGSFRLRVGSWRILFSYQSEDTILIEKIGPRGQIYQGV